MPQLTVKAPNPGGWRAWRWVFLAVLAATLGSHVPELLGLTACNPIYGYPTLLKHVPAHLLSGSCTMDDNDGTTLQALGGAAAELWLHGKLPWWNSYAGLGLPLAGEGQPGAFFLPFVLLLHFASGIVWLKLVMQALAGAAGVALFRELGLSRIAAAVGAMFIVLNGTFAWFAHSHASLPIAFLPALLFGLERCRSRAEAGLPGGPVWVALALGYSLVAGFPETAFMDGLLAALWAMLALLRTPAGRRMALAGKIAAGGLAGLALSAPAWVSFADYLGIASVGLHALVTGDSLAASQAVTLVLPSVFGPPYADLAYSLWVQQGGFFGPALAMLAILALQPGGTLAPVRWVMAGWIVFWLSVFFGAPVTHGIWAAFKPLNEVQITRYAMPSLECAASVLAACAIDNWRRARNGLRVLPAVAAFTGIVAMLLWLAWQGHRLQLRSPAAPFFLTLSLLEAACLAIVIFRLIAAPSSRPRALALLALVSLDATLHFTLPELAGAAPATLELGPAEFLRAHAGLSRSYALAEALPTNYGAWLGVPAIQADTVPFAEAWNEAAIAVGGDINMSVTGWLVLTPARQLAAFRDSAARLRQAGVRFVIVSAADDPFVAAPEPGMALAYQDNRVRIYGMAAAAPYFETFGACRLTVVSRERVHTDCATQARLVRRELLLPGWRATANGARTPVTLPPGAPKGAVDSFMQSVALPAGPADVTFRYAPPHANLIAWLFALGVAATLAMAFPRALLGMLGRARPGAPRITIPAPRRTP